jgi:hypothetical protein
MDRCDASSAALYLFLVTVADAHGLSYYGDAMLARRLHLAPDELSAARQRLIELQLVAYQAPIYQVLALPSGGAAAPPSARAPSTECDRDRARARLAQLRAEMERRRARL